jgi:hypothetical protein
MPLRDDLIDADIDPDVNPRDLPQRKRIIREALKVKYMDAETRAETLAARPDLAHLLDATDRDNAGKRDLRDKYQDAITDLDKIINAETMTAAQVFRAVQFLARTVKFILKMIARQYRAEQDEQND